jgi:hypothetical protein
VARQPRAGPRAMAKARPPRRHARRRQARSREPAGRAMSGPAPGGAAALRDQVACPPQASTPSSRGARGPSAAGACGRARTSRRRRRVRSGSAGRSNRWSMSDGTPSTSRRPPERRRSVGTTTSPHPDGSCAAQPAPGARSARRPPRAARRLGARPASLTSVARGARSARGFGPVRTPRRRPAVAIPVRARTTGCGYFTKVRVTRSEDSP